MTDQMKDYWEEIQKGSRRRRWRFTRWVASKLRYIPSFIDDSWAVLMDDWERMFYATSCEKRVEARWQKHYCDLADRYNDLRQRLEGQMNSLEPADGVELPMVPMEDGAEAEPFSVLCVYIAELLDDFPAADPDQAPPAEEVKPFRGHPGLRQATPSHG